MRFKRSRGGVESKVEALEATALAQLAGQLLDLLGPSGSAPSDVPVDPLEALVGLPPGPVSSPQDPALARLFPDAYGNDAEAATEFRRFTESDLRATKRSAAQAALDRLRPLADSGGKLTLSRDEADGWLTWLNDVRLVLGTRLEVTDDLQDYDADPDDPRGQVMGVYLWLGWLQESLLGCLAPRPQV